MISKLPAWVGSGAFLLALAAGAMNALMVLGFYHLPSSHVTGAVSGMALAFSTSEWANGLRFLEVLLAFFAGATLSGLIIRESHLKLGRRYGVSLIIESLILGVALLGYKQRPFMSQLLVTFACGLQNAMASTYSGAILRTTHMTGIITDLGIYFGNRLAGLKPERRKVYLTFSILCGFVLGGLLSGLLYPILHNRVLFIPIALTSSLSIAYFIYWYRQRSIQFRENQ